MGFNRISWDKNGDWISTIGILIILIHSSSGVHLNMAGTSPFSSLRKWSTMIDWGMWLKSPVDDRRGRFEVVANCPGMRTEDWVCKQNLWICLKIGSPKGHDFTILRHPQVDIRGYIPMISPFYLVKSEIVDGKSTSQLWDPKRLWSFSYKARSWTVPNLASDWGWVKDWLLPALIGKNNDTHECLSKTRALISKDDHHLANSKMQSSGIQYPVFGRIHIIRGEAVGHPKTVVRKMMRNRAFFRSTLFWMGSDG